MAYTTIDDPSAYFHTQLYTGNGSSGLSITNDANAGDFQPDWLWIKPRSASENHVVFDSSRGEDKQLKTNGTDAEDTHSPARVTIESDGFDLDTTDSNYNGNGTTYVAWQWKSNGGTTTTNDASSTGVGNLDSVYQANTDAGFSIVTYSGAASNNLVAHGLGVTPDLMIQKRRNNANTSDGRWVVWHKSLAALHNQFSFLFLHATNSRSEDTSVFGAGANTGPNSETFRIGNDSLINGSGGNHVMYCFAEKQGYSKFGSYTGNGNADGTFVYTGFKPAWVMIKVTTGTKGWHIHDTKRPSYNPATNKLSANASDAESTNSVFTLDLLSNGFKLRSSDNEQNGNGDTYVYMAFAEHPFVGSDGVPTTAR